MTINEARKSGEIVSIGDSQMLRSLRKIKGKECSQEEIFTLFIERKKIKGRKSNQENIQELLEIDEKIDNILFIPEIISIFVEDLRHYEYIGKNGFFVNGIKFKRLMCGAGQARRNNALFITEEFEISLKTILNNGRKDIEITPAKFSAYFSLASSSSLPVSFPYFCVVPDLEIKRIEQIDYIEEIENADDTVEEKSIEIPFNLWDGQGIISPKMAKVWANDLGLDYIPSCFIIRSNFIKGMLAVIDFHEYSEEIENHFIDDVWGNKVNVRDQDIILTQSQFKLWNAYNSCQEYVSSCKKNDLGWSVSRVTPKNENTHCFLNYQFIQSLELEDSAIKELCQKTIDYFLNISKNKIEYSLLYLLGKNSDTYEKDVFEKLNDNVTKALILNNDLLHDPYVKTHLINSLNKKIRDSYMGNILVDGQYTMMVADPYAFLEYIFKIPLKGLLNRNEHYNKYWSDKKEKNIVAMRAPLTWRSEIQVLNLKENNKTNKWFQYLKNCVVYNVFGNDCLLSGGADFDGDIICLTNNKQILNGVCGGIPIYYDVKKAPKVKIVEDELYSSDMKGFNSKVGFVTNCATTSFSLLPKFEKNSEEYKEIINRLKRFRKEQGSTIDASKGLIIKKFPLHWTRWIRVPKDASQEILNEINFKNRIVIDKRPLFMRWVYTSYNKKYIDYNKKKNGSSLIRFNKKLSTLIDQFNNYEQLIPEEMEFVKNYYRYGLFVETDCLMNKLSKYMESKIKELKYDLKDSDIKKSIEILKSKNSKTDGEKIKKLFDLFLKYKSEKRNFSILSDDNNFLKYKTIEQFNKSIRQEAYLISSDGSELCDMAVDICYVVRPGDNKSFVWNIFGEELVENIKEHKQQRQFIPIEDENGKIEYLGNYYSMKEIKIDIMEEDISEYL